MADTINLDATQAMRVLRKFVYQTTPSRVQRVEQNIARYAISKAVALTPVNTGWMASSWRVSLDGNIDEPSPQGTRTRATAEAESLNASESVIRSIRAGVNFVIGNATPHAPYIEYGSPTTQAHYITRRVAMSIGGKFGRIA